jgi:hypothetical protein
MNTAVPCFASAEWKGWWLFSPSSYSRQQLQPIHAVQVQNTGQGNEQSNDDAECNTAKQVYVGLYQESNDKPIRSSQSTRGLYSKQPSMILLYALCLPFVLVLISHATFYFLGRGRRSAAVKHQSAGYGHCAQDLALIDVCEITTIGAKIVSFLPKKDRASLRQTCSALRGEVSVYFATNCCGRA